MEDEAGEIISSVSQMKEGQSLTVIMSDGRAETVVSKISVNEK